MNDLFLRMLSPAILCFALIGSPRPLRGVSPNSVNPQYLLNCVMNFSGYQGNDLHSESVPSLEPQIFAEVQAKLLHSYRQMQHEVGSRFLSPYVKLPSNISDKHRDGLEMIWRLAKDPEEYFSLAQEFEMEVYIFAYDNKCTLSRAFQTVLREEEIKYGFGDLVEVTEFMSSEDYLALVAKGHPVSDLFYKDKPHTVNGHRVQSVLAARWLEKNTGETLSYINLYRYMGDTTYLDELNWEGTGLSIRNSGTNQAQRDLVDLYFYIHDSAFGNAEYSVEAADFTNPVYFNALRKFLPALSAWD